MGLTAAEWKQVSAAGAEILGDDWVTLGKGRKIQVWHVPVGWWAQYIYHENSSSGRFVAWGCLLAKPMSYSQTGDSGYNLSRISRVAKRDAYRSMIDVHDPEALVNFGSFVETDNFTKERNLDRGLAISEEKFNGWCERGKGHPYYGNTRQLLVMRRVLTGSRPLPDLIDDLRWVVEDEHLANRNEKSAVFYPALLAALEAADRPAMEELLLDMRRENLVELGVPDEYVTDVTVPEPKVAW